MIVHYLIFLILNLTEVEFLTIAKKMKPHTMRRMKIEPFPWLRDYFVDMRKLYTELTLEKIENTILGEKYVKLVHYEKMFECQNLAIGEENISDRNKILIKGDPGMGKSTLGRKFGWDWARGIFKLYSVVFFIPLKLVKPDDSMENVILQQHPELEGLEISSRKIRAIFQRFGDRCLLVLDGLNEHGLGKNEDVVKIIRDEKLLDCGIIMSSRPHSTNQVERYFPTVIRVDGFTSEKAKELLKSWILNLQVQGKISQFTSVRFYCHFSAFL